MSGEPFTLASVREAVAVLEANDVRRGVVVPEGHEMVLTIGDPMLTAWQAVESAMIPWYSVLAEAVIRDNDAWAVYDRAVRGPKAPPRKRPRRVARKIEARDGRLRYTPRWAR